MLKIYFSVIISISLCIFSAEVSAQGTFTQVHQLLQANCAGSGCHDGSGTPSFNVSLSDSLLYLQLVNTNPLNPAAVANGNKLVKPGYVDKSFLLKKLAHGFNDGNIHLALKAQEGNPMPSGLPALAKKDIELVRQWILFGAPKTGTVVDTALINKYYSGKGIEDTYPSHAAPDSGSGFQMYVGKIFIAPLSETYYYIKHDPGLPGNIEIPHLTTMMPQSTHHMVIYKFLPGGAANYREGIRPEAESSHPDVSDGIGTGKGLWEYNLPPGSAYFWEQNTILDFNLHIKNPNADSVLATDLYYNVYTQAPGTAIHPMLIRNFPVFTISIPQDGQEHTDTEVANDTNETRYWKIWQLYTHTHKYGTDYDVFMRNPDGSQGNQIYEGWYSYEQDFMVGYYRWGVDVTFEYFPDDSLLQVDPRIGLIHRAKWINTNGPDPQVWGNLSSDEMMVMGFQYIYGDALPALTGVKEINNEKIKLSVFPNPASGSFSMSYILEHQSDIKVELTNVLGEVTTVAERKNKASGNYLEEIELSSRFAPGVYLLTFRTDHSVNTQRIVIE